MKKMLGIIIALLVVIIVIISVAFYTYVRNNNDTNPEVLGPSNNIDDPYMLDGPGSEFEPIFWGHTPGEIQEIIEQYYGNYYGMYDVTAKCYYDEENILWATVSTEYEVTAKYSFDEETGDAVNYDTGEVVYFFRTETYTQSVKTNVEFTDNECIAIGYVTDLNEAEFADKYFLNGGYGEIPYYDYREPVYQNQTGYGNKFVIIPINGDVEITVYDCYLGEDGELYTDNTLIQSISEPFIILDDYIEYIPKMCIKFKYNGFEEMFPITFSGEDGTLDLNGYEMEVKDISLY